jgi:putative transposase
MNPQQKAAPIADPGAVFLTWRLHGSLPTGFLGYLSSKDGSWGAEDFCCLDRMLDRETCGPVWLKDPRIAHMLVQLLNRGHFQLRQYDLHAYVIMSNHVHMLLTPRVAMRTLSDGLKGAIARMANRMLGRRGEHFWQDESFAHRATSDSQFERLKSYIEANPVHAGLVGRPEDWIWSSAHHKSMLAIAALERLQRPLAS